MSGVIEWLRGWTRSDLLALSSFVVGAVAVVGTVRYAVMRLVKAGSLRAGRSERRYASWFIGHWGKYENPYLNDKENLDLSNTYVSLSLCLRTPTRRRAPQPGRCSPTARAATW